MILFKIFGFLKKIKVGQIPQKFWTSSKLCSSVPIMLGYAYFSNHASSIML